MFLTTLILALCSIQEPVIAASAWRNLPLRIMRRPMENKDLFEGDIVIIRKQTDLFGPVRAIVDDSNLWPNGIIPYRIMPDLESSRSVIQSAMRHIEKRTCIRFVEQSKEKAFVLIVKDIGCYSHVGRAGLPQPLSLGKGCINAGTILHELTHVIGFNHEHNRSDRDEYIEINWDNVDSDHEDEFNKNLPHENRLFNSFDYQSIMMYGPLAFSKDDFSPTMKPTKPGVKLVEVHNKKGLTDSDAFRINKLYKCKKFIKI